MWQAASEEIPVQQAAHANTNYTILYITQRNQTIKPNQSNILELIQKNTKRYQKVYSLQPQSGWSVGKMRKTQTQRMYWRRLCASLPACQVGNTTIHYKLNNIYSRNGTNELKGAHVKPVSAETSVNVRSKMHQFVAVVIQRHTKNYQLKVVHFAPNWASYSIGQQPCQ